MKVCFVSNTAGLLGAERALVELLLALRLKQTESFVIVPKRGPLFDLLTELNIPCAVIRYYAWIGTRTFPFWKRLGAFLVSAFATIPVVFRIYRWKADVVCTNTIAVFTGALAAWIIRKPHVWLIHEIVGEGHYMTPFLPFQLTMRLLNSLSDGIVANSETIRQRYAHYLPTGKMHVAYQAVRVEVTCRNRSLRPFKHDDSTKCVSVGALIPSKCHSEAIQAVAELKRAGVEVELAIIGAGPDRAVLEDIVEAEGLGGNVFFSGYLLNPYPVIQAADIVLICSRDEGFGRVAVEAMRLGKPIIAAASGATTELIKNRFNGLLYQPGHPGELAKKLRTLLESEFLQSKLVQNGRRTAERFTLERYGATVLRVFEQVKACHGC
jgi:glycosyltransferase involved in cell wall biosynthesis